MKIETRQTNNLFRQLANRTLSLLIESLEIELAERHGVDAFVADVGFFFKDTSVNQLGVMLTCAENERENRQHSVNTLRARGLL